MKRSIESWNCPHCAAQLDVAPGATEVECHYCGSKMGVQRAQARVGKLPPFRFAGLEAPPFPFPFPKIEVDAGSTRIVVGDSIEVREVSPGAREPRARRRHARHVAGKQAGSNVGGWSLVAAFIVLTVLGFELHVTGTNDVWASVAAVGILGSLASGAFAMRNFRGYSSYSGLPPRATTPGPTVSTPSSWIERGPHGTFHIRGEGQHGENHGLGGQGFHGPGGHHHG